MPITSLANSCQSIFSVDHSPITQSRLTLPPTLESKNQYWQKQFSAVTNIADFKSVLGSISASLPKLVPEDFAALQRIDLVPLTYRFSNHDRVQLEALVKEAVERVNSDVASPIELWLSSLAFHYNPNKIAEFIPLIKRLSKLDFHLAEVYSGHYGLRSWNNTFTRVLHNLPAELRSQLQNKIKAEMTSINLNHELMAMKNGQIQVPKIRLYRRNLEIFAAQLNRPYLLVLSDQLRKAGSKAEVIEAVDRYYSGLKQTLPTTRGNYSFSKVLTAAEIIRSNLGEYLSKHGGSILMYGSYTNGKASFKTSDIDIKFTEGFFSKIMNRTEQQIQSSPFSLFLNDMVLREKENLSHEFATFWKLYQKAEIELGNNLFGRAPEHPSELLTSLFPPKKDTNDANDVKWYNPLVIRIDATHITIQIADLIGEPILTEFKIY